MPSTVNVCLLPAGGNRSAGHDWMHQGCSSSIMSLNACVYGLHLDLQIAVHQEFYFRNFLNVLLLFNFIIGTCSFQVLFSCIVTNSFRFWFYYYYFFVCLSCCFYDHFCYCVGRKTSKIVTGMKISGLVQSFSS